MIFAESTRSAGKMDEECSREINALLVGEMKPEDYFENYGDEIDSMYDND